MDAALKDTGISFANDVRAWLGTQVAFVLRVGDGQPSAMIIGSKDEAKARVTLDKTRTANHDMLWSSETHDGVEIWSAKPGGNGHRSPIAYTYVDHAAVIADATAMVEEVCHTRRSPASSTTFEASVPPLPAPSTSSVSAAVAASSRT